MKNEYPPLGASLGLTAPLTINEMVDVAVALNEAYEHVVENTYGNSRAAVMQFGAELILRRKPYLLVTREGFTDIAGEVFGNDDHRDFLFTLYFAFSSRWGMTKERYSVLVENLTWSVCPVGIGAEFSGAPSVIAQRLTSPEEVRPLLEANPWLVMILLLQTFIRVSPPKSN